jgi:coenzyme F420 hydrogenase subunit beta
MKIQSIQDVVRWRLCVGCGACAYVSDGRLGMVNDPALGHRPEWSCPDDDGVLRDALKVCPAAGTSIAPATPENDPLGGIAAGSGPVLEVWEGHATDPETRFLGSSGGALTALARYALDGAGMSGVLHVGTDPDDALSNRTVMSRSFGELVANTGSRYAPASVCDGLRQIEDAPGPCMFIGQPSEVAALRKAQALRPRLDRNVGVALSFFCAGSPATLGTTELLKAKGIDPSRVGKLRYRGRGWPGMFAVWLKGENEPALEMTYAESWGFVQAYRPWGVHVWPDGCGEQADVSCGDPWYREVKPGEAGSSLLVVRTERGRTLVRQAMEAGYLELRPGTLDMVVASQRNLLTRKGAVWGRLTCMRLMGLPAPVHKGYRMFRTWLRIPFPEKLRSTLGTLKRILTRGYLKPVARKPTAACGKEQMQ